MPSNPIILSDLALIKEARHPVELLSIYKGVPFVCTASIEQIEGENVELHASDKSLACLEIDGQARLLGSHYFEPAVGRVKSLDLGRGQIKLCDFSYAGARLGERMIMRVEPRQPVPVDIECAGQTCQGQIVDISFSGLGAWVRKDDFQPALKPGAELTLRFALQEKAFSLPGVILSLSKVPQHQRISVRYSQGWQEKLDIFHYLVDRRAEIEQEVLELYQAALQASGG